MRRYRAALIVFVAAVPVLTLATIRALTIGDPWRFIHDVDGPEQPPCAHNDELARRYHRGPLPCERYYCWNREQRGSCSNEEAGSVYARFEADAPSSGFGDQIPETLALLEQWTEAEERSAHDWPAERIDDLRRNAGLFDRVRIAINRDRIAASLSVDFRSGIVRPPPLCPRSDDEYRRLRALWLRNKLAPDANYLRKISC